MVGSESVISRDVSADPDPDPDQNQSKMDPKNLSTCCIKGIANQNTTHYYTDSSSSPTLICNFFRPVIGQVAREERIAALIKIVTLANLYFLISFTTKHQVLQQHHENKST